MASILILEDNSDLQEVFTSLFQMSGHKVFSVSDKKEALKIIEQNADVSIAFIDLIIPGDTCFDLIESLSTKNPKIKVVAMSGSLEPEFKQKAMQSGACLFLGKPFSIEEVCSNKGLFDKLS